MSLGMRFTRFSVWVMTPPHRVARMKEKDPARRSQAMLRGSVEPDGKKSDGGAHLPLAALIRIGFGWIRLGCIGWIGLGWHQRPGGFIRRRGRIADNLPAKRPAELA